MIRSALLPSCALSALLLAACSSGGNPAEPADGEAMPKLSITPLSAQESTDKALGQSVSRAIAIEGDQPTELSSAVFLVSLSAAATSTVSVTIAVAADSAGASPAESGLDFKPINFVLNLPAGETSATVAVPVMGDLLFETNETFMVTLSNPQNATLATSRAYGEIVSNDPAPSVVVEYTPGGNGSFQEGTGGVSVVTPVCARVGGSTEINGKIRWKLNLGTASAADIRLLDTDVVTLPGTGSRRCARLEVTGDSSSEPLETASVEVEIVNFLQPGNPMSRSISIIDDDIMQPQNVQLTIQGGNLVASWTAVPNAIGYEVSLATTDEFGTINSLTSVTTSSANFGSAPALLTVNGSASIGVVALFAGGGRSASSAAGPLAITGSFSKSLDVANPGSSPLPLRNQDAELQLSVDARFLNLASFSLSSDSFPIPALGSTESLQLLALTNDGRRVVYAIYDHDISVEDGKLLIYDRVAGTTAQIHHDGLKGYFAAAIGAGDVIWKVDTVNATGLQRYNPVTATSSPIPVTDTTYTRIQLAGSGDERFAYAIQPPTSPGFSGYVLIRDSAGNELLNSMFAPAWPPTFRFASRAGASALTLRDGTATTHLFRIGLPSPQALPGEMLGVGVTTDGTLAAITSGGIFHGSAGSTAALVKVARWPATAVFMAVLSDGSIAVQHGARLKKLSLN